MSDVAERLRHWADDHHAHGDQVAEVTVKDLRALLRERNEQQAALRTATKNAKGWWERALDAEAQRDELRAHVERLITERCGTRGHMRACADAATYLAGLEEA